MKNVAPFCYLPDILFLVKMRKIWPQHHNKEIQEQKLVWSIRWMLKL